MLIPPVSLDQDQKWFVDQLGRRSSEGSVTPADIEEIDLMDPKAFERWALRRCVSFGWEASSTLTSHDGGADVIILHRSSGARVAGTDEC
jgi:HJR/Mrr/RecB family endonuclease